MADCILNVETEVLYEKTSGVLTKYENYINSQNSPLECIVTLYEKLVQYLDRILMCEDYSTFQSLKNNVIGYEKIIDNVFVTSNVGA